MNRPLRAARLARPALTLAATLVALAACSESSTAPAATEGDASPSLSATAVVTAAATADAGASAARPSASVAAATPAPTTTAGVSVVGCTGTTVVLTADEKRSLDLHNGQRATAKLAPFCVHPALTAAARAHARDMLAKGYFSHTSQNGDSFVTRVVRAGYTGWRALAENIAWGSGSYGSADAIFASWMNSAGHRANITNGSLREIGIGVAAGTYRTYAGAKMYTVDFGTR